MGCRQLPPPSVRMFTKPVQWDPTMAIAGAAVCPLSQLGVFTVLAVFFFHHPIHGVASGPNREAVHLPKIKTSVLEAITG